MLRMWETPIEAPEVTAKLPRGVRLLMIIGLGMAFWAAIFGIVAEIVD